MKSKKNKKDKKKKKHKKESHKRRNEASSEESSGPEMEWVEASLSSSTASHKSPSLNPSQGPSCSKDPTLPPVPPQKEDNWLESPFLTAATSLADIRKKKNAEKEQEREKEKNKADMDYSARELNPYWKDGGTGLPEEQNSKSQSRDPGPARRMGHGVDGGVSWLKKSYQRAVEQARESGRSVDEVVTERWGSVEEYERLLSEAMEASGGHSRSRDHRGPPQGWKKRRDDDGHERQREDERRDRRRDEERDERRRKEIYDRSESRDRNSRYECTSRRDSSSRGFKRPGERDDDSLYSKFRKPGDDDFSRDKDRSHKSLYDRGSSSRERSRSDDIPSWRKTGFKKPGEDDDSVSRTSSSSRTIPPPAYSSSSSGGWRKPGFKRPGDDEKDTRSSSSSGGWRKSGDKRLDDRYHAPTSSSSSQPPLPQSSSTSSRRSRRRSESDEENSDDITSSGSSSPDSRKDESGGEEKERSPSPVKILSDIEMNQLGAKLVKAEIMGNEALVQKLKTEIETARQARIAQKTKLLENKGKERTSGEKAKQKPDKESEEVILTRTDRSGQSWPLAEQTAPPSGGKKMKKKNIVTHDKDGERKRYFADDDDIDLETMVRREKMGSSDDHNRLLNKVASKKLALLDSEFNTLDEMFVSSAAKAESRSKVEERERSRAIADHQHTMAKLAKCPFCLESEEMKKHLIIALGLKVYLCVPQTRCISEGQCYIVPMQHAVASTGLDEDVWAEIQIFRKGLTKMFEDHDMDAVFLETCMNPKKQRHMCIECLPIPRELGEMAPIYFKKAIQESESEWTQHKKLIDTRQKDIRRSVPKGFPFFSVDFGLDGGFAHVIEDELVFPHYFGKEVIGGLLDVEPRLWRHPPKENFEDQSKRVLELSKWWKPFDWTKKIDREKS